MIARRWRGWADGPAKADAYVAHFEGTVRPQLEGTGFVGATLERVEDDGGQTEIVVVTRWASMEAIRAFATKSRTRSSRPRRAPSWPASIRACVTSSWPTRTY